MATILSDVERTLERSGGLPLLIRLQIDDYCNIAHSCVLPIMELLCKQVHRWQMLCISGPMEIISSISRYTSVVDCGSPLLSSLILTGVKTGDESENDVFVSIGSPTAPLPAPSYISTWGIKISPETWNFAQLRDLTLGVSAVFELVQILAISPRLTSLTSSISCSHSNPTNAPAMLSSRERVLDFSIVNLHMKSWQVHIDYHGLFPRCTFPALEDLDCNIYPGPFTPGLRDFLARSQCPLTTMRLIIKCEEAEFIEILHLIPTLRDLDITSNNISSHFFQYLGETAIRSENGPDFLPNLETFQFQANQVSGLAFNWSLFRIMLPATTSAKGSKCRPLSKVTVHMHRSQVGNLTPAVQADLASVIDDGLEIVGNYMYGDSGFNLLESLDPLQQALSRLRGSRR
ncbi:hypothetical protein CPB83DRAFT_854465 [Crepidotus variabilis]|uniref:Uncharacterized protein n=1 Tax=Crepidotus variabilis TaxID=179855 RepID=A0A9P6EGA3_9AGAR|nr:hypothetical protein CPB83DRAFT_854465 [Crepidotus variabilis]